MRFGQIHTRGSLKSAVVAFLRLPLAVVGMSRARRQAFSIAEAVEWVRSTTAAAVKDVAVEVIDVIRQR
jgi:hypothetical protein